MKGSLLAGGLGTRLKPLTSGVNKQLLPVYDKPLIYYPLATLMFCGIREILVICRPEDYEVFQNILGDGSQWGIEISLAVQLEPKGIPEAFIIGKEFIKGHRTALILGDNIFFGHNLRAVLDVNKGKKTGATIFVYWVTDPQRFGVVELGDGGNILSLEEKPTKPKSNYAITGLYFYDTQVSEIASALTPSKRGELEITELNQHYLAAGELAAHRLERGFAWLDTGTPEAILDASNFIATIERRQGLKVACLEEIAWRSGWIDDTQLSNQAGISKNSNYGAYLRSLLSMGK
ncbi:MAG: glucose-1-phosphate thymidylyltransferase RfbA [Pseudomonadota bacterium]|nr:glucose-1-phosphate thymidylyltransferase RfbA [Pseudomonadota bacterium]